MPRNLCAILQICRIGSVTEIRIADSEVCQSRRDRAALRLIEMPPAFLETRVPYCARALVARMRVRCPGPIIKPA